MSVCVYGWNTEQTTERKEICTETSRKEEEREHQEGGEKRKIRSLFNVQSSQRRRDLFALDANSRSRLCQ